MKKSIKSNFLKAAKQMPELLHSERRSPVIAQTSEVVRWLLAREESAQFLFSYAVQRRAIIYCQEKDAWIGNVNCSASLKPGPRVKFSDELFIDAVMAFGESGTPAITRYVGCSVPVTYVRLNRLLKDGKVSKNNGRWVVVMSDLDS